MLMYALRLMDLMWRNVSETSMVGGIQSSVMGERCLIGPVHLVRGPHLEVVYPTGECCHMSGGVSEAVIQGLPRWKKIHQSIWISWRYQLVFPICMWIITIIEVSRCVIGFVDSDFDLLSEL